MVCHDDHCDEPVWDVFDFFEGASLRSFVQVCHEVVEALVWAFLPADELNDLDVRVCRSLNVFINFFDDEICVFEVIWAEALAVDPLQCVVGQRGRECGLGLLVLDCRLWDGIDA